MSTISEALKKAQNGRTGKTPDAVTFLRDPFFDTNRGLNRPAKRTSPKRPSGIFGILLVTLLFLSIGVTAFSFLFLNNINRYPVYPTVNIMPRTVLTAPAYPKKQLAERSFSYAPDKKTAAKNEVIPKLPPLKLEGIMSTGKSPNAIIDGLFYKENDTIREYTLEKIFPDKILLRSEKRKKYLYLR